MPKLTVITRKVPLVLVCFQECIQTGVCDMPRLIKWLLDSSCFRCIADHQAYGGAYDVMSSKHLRGDVNYAWFDPILV